MNNNVSPDGFRPMIQISVNKEGKHKVDIAPVSKQVIINLLADTLKLYAMKPDNVTKAPVGMSAGDIRNWINRKKKK